jgi:hypothetical protein
MKSDWDWLLHPHVLDRSHNQKGCYDAPSPLIVPEVFKGSISTSDSPTCLMNATAACISTMRSLANATTTLDLRESNRITFGAMRLKPTSPKYFKIEAVSACANCSSVTVAGEHILINTYRLLML